VLAVTELESAAVDKPATAATTDAAAAFATYAVLQAENGDAAGAFATSERLRGLDIRAGLATNERDIARGMTPEEREQERALASELTTQLARLTRERELPKPDAAQIAALEKVVDEAREKRRAFLDGLFERLPDLRLWRGLSPPATAADAAPLLDDKTVVLSFVLDEDDVLVFTLTRAERSSTNEGDQAAASANTAASPVLVESHLLAMKRRTIAERVALLQQPAVVGNPAAWQKAIADIAAIIPPSAWAKVERASRVAIVPQDVLWRVPFAALPSGSGVLIDHASVAVGGSLTGLLRAAAAPHTVPDSLLAIGAPELAAATIDRLKQVAPGWPLRTQEAAEIEIGGIAHPYASARAEQLTRAAATESGVRARMGDTAVLHVAAPFRINAASPLFSSVLLARADPSAAQDRSNDGALELREIVTLPLRAEVAVFSDGGATSMRDGAAAADVLHWGWLAAGVPSVMLSRWTTPSPASDRLLAEFHTRLSTGASAADALRGAQLAIRESAETSAPIYWAAWMVVGR
jgi:CHAT domain-containing protein